MSELKAFDVGLGRYCEDGSPCVVAFDADQNPRILNEKVYLKSAADKVIAELKENQRWRKCSEEMPQNYDDGDFFLVAVEHESTTCPKGCYVTLAELVDGNWSDDEGRDIDEDIEYDLEDSAFRSQVPKGTKKGFYRSKVTHWMPLPSAPKEEK